MTHPEISLPPGCETEPYATFILIGKKGIPLPPYGGIVREEDTYSHLRGPNRQVPQVGDFRIQPNFYIMTRHTTREVHLVEQLRITPEGQAWVPVRTDPSEIDDPFRGRGNY